MEVNGNEKPSCVRLNVISDCIVLLVHLIADRNRVSPEMSSDIDSVFISCYKIQYVFGSPCPFESVFLSAESTAVGRIFMD